MSSYENSREKSLSFCNGFRFSDIYEQISVMPESKDPVIPGQVKIGVYDGKSPRLTDHLQHPGIDHMKGGKSQCLWFRV